MSRRRGDVILIGNDIEIVIAQIGRSRVKVGIRAPRSIPVIAQEVKLVRDQNVAAVAKPSSAASLDSLVAQLHPAASLPPHKISGLAADEVIVRQETGSPNSKGFPK